MNKIQSALKEAGLRATSQRTALLGTLVTATVPKTVEELRARLGTVDLVTVYRNLQNLAFAGIVREVRFKDSKIRYEFADGAHHHHLVCTDCGTIDELPACTAESLEKEALKKSKRFASVEEHALEFFGTCRECISR